MAFPKLIAQIKGVFYDSKDQNTYYFIFPNVYHGDNSKLHSLNTLTAFNNKVESYCTDQKLNTILSNNNVNSVNIKRPLFQDHKLIAPSNSFTTFKCRSKTKLDLIIGTEYLLDINCYGGQFVNPEDSGEYIIYWLISINNIKKLEI